MKKFSALFLTSIIMWGSLAAQSGSIKGSITDTINKQHLANTTIALLRAKDSILITFTRSDKQGNFDIKQIQPGKYIAMFTYPAYLDYMDAFEVKDASLDLGVISMTLKSRLLEEVFVKQTIAAIKLRGDTIEYNADSFKVRQGANVEEMLRKLPGLQVDKDGNITAQGEKVQKILVDGEEFFGDDPTIATKNLQADAIAKVQVFDKKSDQAVFTGIDDGLKTKTINLTMKEDKKKGYFGKVEVAAGPPGRWSNNAMANSFKAKRKLSAYGIMSNTGKTGMNWTESSKYGATNSMQYDADGGYFYSFGGGDDFDNGGGFYGQGLPKAWAGGVHYSKKYNGDKQNVNGSYRYNKLITAGNGSSFSQSILPDTLYFIREKRNTYSSKFRNALNGTYEIQIDSFTSLKIGVTGSKGESENRSAFNSGSFDEMNNAVNISNRTTTATGENDAFTANVILRKRFKKAGRTLSWAFDNQMGSNKSDGLLVSINEYFGKNGLLRLSDTVDQRKVNSAINSGIYTRLSYTEPVVKNVFMEVSYGLRKSNSESEKISYDKSLAGKYDVVNDTFSNHYDFKVVTNSGGMMWRYNGKKVTFSMGSDLAQANFRQTDILRDTLLEYHYTNLFPKANFNYKFNTNSRISFNYNGSTNQPRIEQIQPLRDNYNPLNISIGNPNLTQEFRHNFSTNYNFYKVLTQQSFYGYANVNFVSNAITNNAFTDTLGRRVFQYINMNGNYNGYMGADYGFKYSKLDVRVGFGLNASFSEYNSIINNIKNSTQNNSYGASFSLSKYKDKKFSVYYRSQFKYNESQSTIRRDINNNYYTHAHSLSINYTLPYRMEINANVESNFRQKTKIFQTNNDITLLNAFIGRKFFKNDQGMIRLEVYDLLNQNRGFTRSINTTILKEDTYETLSRYFLLTFVWNFSKSPGASPANDY